MREGPGAHATPPGVSDLVQWRICVSNKFQGGAHTQNIPGGAKFWSQRCHRLGICFSTEFTLGFTGALSWRLAGLQSFSLQ